MTASTANSGLRAIAAAAVLVGAVAAHPAAWAQAAPAYTVHCKATEPRMDSTPELKDALGAIGKQDWDRAETLLAPLVARKDRRAQTLLGGFVYGNEKSKKHDPAKALALLKDAAERCFPPAMEIYGVALGSGMGGATDLVEAYKWMVLASREGLKTVVAPMSRMSESMTDDQLARAKRAADEFKPRS
ncbi:MAG: sel1 repeat family protein [Rhodospirillales bacterium]|nr:MAG: sel1 repeat family protein [Rhodospirillales bacterium]